MSDKSKYINCSSCNKLRADNIKLHKALSDLFKTSNPYCDWTLEMHQAYNVLELTKSNK